jgi:dolichol-phosphate mannosyltransferase
MNAIGLSIIIPVYNEAGVLPELMDRVIRCAEQVEPGFELILCDDGSEDDGARIILERARTDARVKLVRLSRNFGHHPAVQAGMDHARGRAVLLMDADLQDPPELIPEMVRRWREGFEIVYTCKRSRGDPIVRRTLFGAFYILFNWLSAFAIEPGVGIFSLLDRRAADVFRRMPERNKYMAGMRQWVGFRQFRIVYDRPERLHGQARQTLAKLIRLGLDAIFSFSRLPLQLVWVLGMVGITASVAGIGYVLLAKLVLGTALLGWSSQLIAVLFLGSVQLVSIGILGEYQLRIYEEVKQRPYYVVSTTHGFEDGAR